MSQRWVASKSWSSPRTFWAGSRVPKQRAKTSETLDPSVWFSFTMIVAETSTPYTERALGSRYEALIRVSQAISAHRDPEKLFPALADELREIIHFDSIGIVQYDEAGNEVEWHLAEKCKEMGDERCRELPQDETITWWVYQHQEAVVIPCLERETRFPAMIELIKRCGMQSGCALPLTTVHRRLGVIWFGSSEPDAYSEEDVFFLSLVADQIALATDDALNFQASQVAQNRLKMLLDLTNSVVSNLELRELLRAIAANVRRVMQCDAVGVHLPDPESDGDTLRIYALDFPDGKGLLKEDISVRIEGTPPGEAFRTGKPVMVNMADPKPGADPDHLQPEEHRQVSGEGIKSGCLLPLISRNRILGVLGLGRREENAFTQGDVDFLMQVANQVAIAIENALAYGQIAELKDKLAQEKLYLEDEIRSEMNFEEMVGKSAALRRVLKEVETVAPTDSTVLIYGETGTGKELIARALHNLSARRSGAFVKLNCAAIPTGLLESELFGHERGAFTGAIARRIGRFELAHRGTVFLDEVGEIPLELQPKLLRVLQEREFERLGSTRTLRSDARLIAATNRDLAALVEEQKFRSDLFYRLNVFPIRIPALRERPEDIPLLVSHFAQQFGRRMNKNIETIPSETMNALCAYPWPGNIRELQNLIERAVILSPGPALKVSLADLKDISNTTPRPSVRKDGAPEPARNIRSLLEETERKQILSALEESNWIVAGPNGAAIRLGMKRSTMQLRMQRLGISRRNQPTYSS
jgi:formate hydrogenlyase transcriptional activator